MIAAGYSMDLYCDRRDEQAEIEGGHKVVDALGHRYDEFPHQFYGESRAEVTREARERGWRINWRERTAVCPKCAKLKANDRADAA